MEETENKLGSDCQSAIKAKLDLISDIWNYYIWDHKLCNNKIKFSEDVRTNYFGDILGYFGDTFDIIFKQKFPDNYTDRFSYNISLLQAIYVQQDFIEEMLIIFKCKIDKGELKKDLNYSQNREIRNELIGHPIRKPKRELISSTTFGYQQDPGVLTYLRYHRDNNFEFEAKHCSIAEIIDRHGVFLNNYFDVIIEKLKEILIQFSKELVALLRIVDSQPFEKIISFAEIQFETIFKNNYGYDKDTILKVYHRQNEHKRYLHLIKRFIRDLKIALNEKINDIMEKVGSGANVEQVNIKISYMNTDDMDDVDEGIKHRVDQDYYYVLGKLGTNRNKMDFDFHSKSLRREFEGNIEVLNELAHMESHSNNDLEFYSAYYLLRYLVVNE